MSPFAKPFRQLGQMPTAQPRPANPFLGGLGGLFGGRGGQPMVTPSLGGQMDRGLQPAEPVNPFAEN